MFQDRDGETELLLGNKQLLGIFFVLVVLFAVFFTAGYMVGRNSGESKLADSPKSVTPVSSGEQTTAESGESHDVAPAPSIAASSQAAVQDHGLQPSANHDDGASPQSARSANSREKIATASPKSEAERDQEPGAATSARSTYLQVVALSHNEASAVAKILSKKGFRTRIAPKPGTQLYRVLVGPVRDAGDLNATREALKNKGFREVFVQHL
jgi:cell division septation protein DedD